MRTAREELLVSAPSIGAGRPCTQHGSARCVFAPRAEELILAPDFTMAFWITIRAMRSLLGENFMPPPGTARFGRHYSIRYRRSTITCRCYTTHAIQALAPYRPHQLPIEHRRITISRNLPLRHGTGIERLSLCTADCILSPLCRRAERSMRSSPNECIYAED